MWLTLLTNKYVWIGVAFAVLTAWGVFWKWDAGRWETKYETFVTETRAIGLVAEAKKKETEAKQEKAQKEITDALQGKLAALSADNDRLRRNNASRGILPKSSDPAAPTPGRACASWPDLERALSDFARETEGFAEEGNRAEVVRDAWLKWWGEVSH